MDMQPPIAVCKDVTVTLSAAGTVMVTAPQVNGGTIDNCPGNLTYDPIVQNYNCSNVGNNNYTLTVTDPEGNSSTCVATVTVRDVSITLYYHLSAEYHCYGMPGG
jgi:hypothetical protein